MDQSRASHHVRAYLARLDTATLLALVSTLHRRGVEVIDAQLGSDRQAQPFFTVTFLATSSQARTLTASLSNRIDVLDAELVPAPRPDHDAPTPN